MNFFKKTERNASIVFQFTLWHVVAVTSLIFVLATAIFIFAGYFLMENSKQEILHVQNKILATVEEKDPSIQENLDDTLYPDYPNYFVKILDEEGETLAKTRGWSKEFEEEVEEDITIFGFPHFMWNDDRGLFYRDQLSWKGPEENGVIFYEVELNHINQFMILLLKIFLITSLLSLIATPLIIYQVTRRKMRPLLEIIQSVNKVKSYSDLKETIAVPHSPKELTDLAESINILLHRLEKQLEREKHFIANASHELRTPLTSFNGYINLMKRWGKNQPDVLEKSISALDSENRRMQRLIDQLMMLAKSEQSDLQFEKVDVIEVCKTAVQQVWKADGHISLIEEYEDQVIVQGEEGYLTQVLVILLDNAQRYSKDGGTVLLQVVEEDGKARIRVKDTGPGIPVEDQAKVFDRFYRVDKARSRETGGTGLGLAIAKELVELHGGEIVLESEVGKGSTFTVELPILKR
ncbi:sensor histidine kinase [Pseudalkalibacillus sp. SCS-8]|uniref:sensor histidine kinase n=1 Tax=Pseudalkalibacillus nanhaiensis TaxID=3115291 RepID=UPI0032DAF6BB